MPYRGYKEAIEDLLACAYKFDDKPHLLYSCVRRIALCYEPEPEDLVEVLRLMDQAYEDNGPVVCRRCRHYDDYGFTPMCQTCVGKRNYESK